VTPVAGVPATTLASVELAAAVLGRLRTAGATVAVAESLTGGLVGATLTAVAGASDGFRGGVVVYATDLKATLAAVPADLLAAEGPVSPRTAAAMATGVRTRLGADWGLALTGVAGPEPQGGQPVGTVHIGLHGPAGTAPEVHSPVFAGDRGAIRDAAVAAALTHLLESLEFSGAARR
jgi:nicotinamide-nucleotide amidase